MLVDLKFRFLEAIRIAKYITQYQTWLKNLVVSEYLEIK
jgi:hypothetical protein